ncbi:DUF1453 domain-containing protein [Streptomyces sp. NPDC059092]|uniref:DUF1453 domain-containing protein n=1 Tax=Streptomyces sp. NPDC059092 TaxID=3346725 RepID=UPI0036A0BFA4
MNFFVPEAPLSSLIDVLLIAAVVVLVVARQLKARRVATGGRGVLVVPAVLVFLALRRPGLLGADERPLSLALLGVELVVGVAMGAGWAWTTRLWTGPDGTVRSKGTRATLAVWAIGIAVRLGLTGLGALLGVHQGSGALMLALAASVLVRDGILALRARTGAVPSAREDGEDGPQRDGVSYARGASYGGGVASAPWKDRV